MTLKSTFCGVAGNRFQTCMTSAAKKKINIELEITLLLILDKEMRHRPQLKFNSRCIAFQIASYLKKMFGCESRELAGSDSSQKSSDSMKRLILSNDCWSTSIAVGPMQRSDEIIAIPCFHSCVPYSSSSSRRFDVRVYLYLFRGLLFLSTVAPLELALEPASA